MLHSFTRNYNDLSTDAGFQFEFYCDNCGNGYKSTFQESQTYESRKKADRLSEAAGGLGGLFGGIASNLGGLVERGIGAVGDNFESQGPQWRKEQERFFDDAQEEVRPHFRKCPACSQWVCADCWNEDEGLCITCAPRESAYVAQARNQAMRNNIDAAAETATVWHGKLETRTTTCPNCGKPAGTGKFCNHCGSPLGMNKCPNCGANVALGLPFCGECGSPMNAKAVCPNCGAENEQGSAFCNQCGTKI